MQQTLKFEYKNLFVTSFVNFAKNNYFNFFLSFAKSQNTFLMLKFEDENFKQLKEKIKNYDFTYLENAKNFNQDLYLNFDGDLIFVNLPSFLTAKMEDEMKFLDVMRTLQGKEKTFIGITFKSFSPKFYLKDVESRFSSAVSINFENDMNFDFKTIGVDFLFQNGIKIEPEVLDFMLIRIERDILSFTLFIEELKKFVEITKTKIKKSHFEAIFSNYEKARNQKDF